MTHWDIVNGAKDHCLLHAVIVVSDVVIFAETCFWLIHYLGSREEITLRMPLVLRPSARKLVYVHLVRNTLANVQGVQKFPRKVMYPFSQLNVDGS